MGIRKLDPVLWDAFEDSLEQYASCIHGWRGQFGLFSYRISIGILDGITSYGKIASIL